MKFRLFLAVLLMSVFTAGLAIAQEPAGAKDLEITGELWMGMGLNLTKDYGNATDLQLDRTQINFKKQVSEMFTGEVKIEAVPVNNINDSIIGDDGSVIGVGNVGYGMYLKSTKISAAMKLGPLNVVGKAGIIETPMGQFMEDQKGDYMFNLDGSEFVVDNTIETEYDAALGLDFTMGKLLEASFTMGHGDGYTNLGGKNAPDYKYQYTGRITVSPIEQLKVSAFFSMDDKTPQDEWVEQNGDTILLGIIATNPNLPASLGGNALKITLNPGMAAAPAGAGDLDADGVAYSDADYLLAIKAAGYDSTFIENYVLSKSLKEAYYGAGIGWDDGSINAGLNFFYIKSELDGEATEADGDMIFDFWANANLKKYVGMPVAVYTGYSYLKDAETDDLAEEAANTSEWFIGAGYEFEGEAAMYVFYREHDSDISGEEKEKHLKFVGTLNF